MVIQLRQEMVSVGTPYDGRLSLKDSGFLRVTFVEIFEYGVVFCPSTEGPHYMISKVPNDCWEEPNTGIVYEFLQIRDDERGSFPQHLEIIPDPDKDMWSNKK